MKIVAAVLCSAPERRMRGVYLRISSARASPHIMRGFVKPRPLHFVKPCVFRIGACVFSRPGPER
eukprot:1172932-Pleurochrysis_carterae.AAC.1